LKHEL